MRISLRRACGLSIALVVATAPVARTAGAATLSAYADRDGVTLESSKTNAEGASEWEGICVLPCERLQLPAWPTYRVSGPLILSSENFHLLLTEQPQVLRVQAKTPAERSTDRGLLIAGLIVAGVGVAMIIPGVAIMGAGCRSETTSPCNAGDGVALTTAGAISIFVGGILTTVGGVLLANSNTSTTLSVETPGGEHRQCGSLTDSHSTCAVQSGSSG